MEQQVVALGIECIGASYSFCVALAEDAGVMAAHRFTLHVNAYEQKLEEVAAHIYDLSAATLRLADRSDTPDALFERGGRICVGLTGITTAQDREKEMADLWDYLQFPISQCLATGDVEVLLPGSTCSLTGAVIICHAGSVAYARKHPGTGVRVGGWGFLMGDEGSGYYMGRKALHALTWHRDHYEKPCPELVRTIRYRLDNSQTEWGDVWRALDIPARDSDADSDYWIDYLIPYSQEIIERGLYRYAISDLVKAIVSAAENEQANGKTLEDGNAVALKIIDHSINHISSRLCLAVSEAGLEGQVFPLVLAGGVVVHNRFIRERLEKRILEKCPSAEIQPVAEDGVYHIGAGAAMHALTGTFDSLPSPDISGKVLKDTRIALTDSSALRSM